jgi:hypothetical protein
MSAFHEMPVSAATSATCATSASCCCGRLGRGGIPAVQLAPAGYWISSAGREPNFGQFLTLL